MSYQPQKFQVTLNEAQYMKMTALAGTERLNTVLFNALFSRILDNQHKASKGKKLL